MTQKNQQVRKMVLAVGLAVMQLHVMAADGDATPGIVDMGAIGGGSMSNALGVNAAGDVVVGSSQFNAFRWTQAGGYENLTPGFVGPGATAATAVNAAGDVVVGYSGNDAFRWTNEGGLVLLPTPGTGSGQASAAGVNAAGDVVVGYVGSSAFRWTEADGMRLLGEPWASRSYALGVNAAGDVVVGVAEDVATQLDRAFRWTDADGMKGLEALNGGSYSTANAVNAAGDVVVGFAADGNNTNMQTAVRWTNAGGVQSLGMLDGASGSYARAVNAAGDVVVGTATIAGPPGTSGFRWTQASGMQSVEQWLADNGVTVTGLQTQEANGVNAEGNVVVGNLANGFAYIARVSSSGSGLIDLAQFNQGLGQVAASGLMAVSNTDLVMHGMHGSPMRMLLENGKSGFWLAGDYGRQDRTAREGNMAVGELGYGYRFNDAVQLNVAAGHTHSKTDTNFGGRTRAKANYILPELIFSLPSSLYATVSAYYTKGSIDVDRGYLNAGTQVLSRGAPDMQTAGVRLRLDWRNFAQAGGVGLTPYVGLSYAQTKIDGYTETGGGFPVRWDQRKENMTTARVGLDLDKQVSERISVQGRVEGVHRFEKNSANTSGQILGMNGFTFAGQELKQTWLRVGAGLEGKIGSGVASLMVNATTEGETAAYWMTAGYRWSF